jgi:hypothetical protein
MDDAKPQVWVAGPLLDGVAGQLLHLGADEQRRGAVVEGVDVGDDRRVLDDRAVAVTEDLLLREAPAPGDPLGDRRRQRLQHLDLSLRPGAPPGAVVGRHVPPPSVVESDRDRRDRRRPLGGEDASLRIGKVDHVRGHRPTAAEHLDPSGEVG